MKSYFTSVFILGIGALLSQIIPIAMSPIYARIFDPKTFGVFAIYTSTVLTIMPLITGKYDLAALSIKSRMHSIILFMIAEAATIIFSIISLIIIVVAYIQEYNFAQKNIIAFSAVPAGLLLGGIISVNINRLTRLGNFKEISKQKIILEASVAAATIALGIAGLQYGMVYGMVFGSAVLLLYIGRRTRLEYILGIFKLSKKKKYLIRKNIAYLKYNATTAVLDGMTVAMPTFYIAQVYGAKETGFFFLATKLINAPVSFLSSSIAQVNLKYISEIKNNNDVKSFIRRQSIFLLSFGMIVSISWYLISNPIIKMLFGIEWLIVVELIKIMVISLPLRFMASTLSTTLGATGRNKTAALWRITAFSSMSVLLISVTTSTTFIDFIKIFVIFEMMIYAFYYFLIAHSLFVFKNKG